MPVLEAQRPSFAHSQRRHERSGEMLLISIRGCISSSPFIHCTVGASVHACCVTLLCMLFHSGYGIPPLAWVVVVRRAVCLWLVASLCLTWMSLYRSASMLSSDAQHKKRYSNNADEAPSLAPEGTEPPDNPQQGHMCAHWSCWLSNLTPTWHL